MAAIETSRLLVHKTGSPPIQWIPRGPGSTAERGPKCVKFGYPTLSYMGILPAVVVVQRTMARPVKGTTTLLFGSLLALSSALGGCTMETGSSSSDITDVPHTPVEGQSISNCWLYAEASWLESMHLAATGEAFDASQSYWSYWHWFNQINEYMVDVVVTPGGSQPEAHGLVHAYGLMAESAFVPEDAAGEVSERQSEALRRINEELTSGRLADPSARADAALIRDVLDDVWGLSDVVRVQLDQVFGPDGYNMLGEEGVSTEGTGIIAPQQFAVRYTERVSDPDVATVKDTNLVTAISEWRSAGYPSSLSDSDLAQQQRDHQIRVQRALHDAQPVIIVWNVDFNAMDSGTGELPGSFNLTTLEAVGSGRQGAHTTVLEDYEAVTLEFGLLEAGVTLDANQPNDQAKLAALLEPTTQVRFYRIKNSWGAVGAEATSAPGFPGYHDLYLDYLNGPIAWCPSVDPKTPQSCTGTTVPLNAVILPPGY